MRVLHMENLMNYENNNHENESTNIDEILANSQNGVIEALKIINNQNKKRDAKIDILIDDMGSTKTKVESLEKNTNVICSPFHSKRKRNFNRLCKARVWELFNHDKDSCEYVLFSHFLFKKIYGDIATHFDLDTWHDLSMEKFEEENSTYSQAKEFASYWTPSNWYVKDCINGMISKRDKGILSPERCRALTEYLRITNNGEINPFVAQAGDHLPNYVKIPREIIYNKDIGDKRVIIFAYLCSRRALDDTVAFSISELCHWSYLKPNYHDGKINHKYLEMLESLSHYGYFESYPNFEKLAKEKKNSTDYYNIKIKTEKYDIPDNFGIIYFDELGKILNFKEELTDIKVNGEIIDVTRMSSAYILLLLSYLRVNMNRNPNKPLCCYRLYQKIAEDIGLSERYISRIVEMLDVMNIIKFQEGKRIRYKKQDEKYGFLTTPKVFADCRHFVKGENGNQVIDSNYDYKIEIQKQLEILEEIQKKMQKQIVDIIVSQQTFYSKGELLCQLQTKNY